MSIVKTRHGKCSVCNRTVTLKKSFEPTTPKPWTSYDWDDAQERADAWQPNFDHVTCEEPIPGQTAFDLLEDM